jgi:predicted enzyme related to lactoylglutathione lyase
MDQQGHNFQMDYIEFPATDIEATKRFYSAVFGWTFTDYGPNYTSFHDGRLGGGFTMSAKPVKGGPLVVLYARDLEAAQQKVVQSGGKLLIETFEFPGGRRFHFADPNGNELAVWSE